jgi:hypothetical protein
MQIKSNGILKELFILISVAVLIRIAYVSINPDLYIFHDTFGYYEIGKNIILSPTVRSWVNPFRPFLYPLFINALVAVTGNFGAPILSQGYFTGERLIGLVQTAVTIAGIIIFYFMLRKIFTTRYVALGVSIFQAISVNFITWERSVLSESLSIPFTLIVGSLMISALTAPRWRTLISITFLSVIGVLLRPATLIYPLIIFPLIAYYHKTAPVFLRSALAFGLFILFALGYAKTNQMNWGYFGIQNGADINMLARIMQFRLPLAPAQDIQPLYSQVREYSITTDRPDVWEFLNTYYVDTYSTPENITQLRRFDMAIIRTYPLAYISHALADIPGSLLFTDPYYEIAPANMVGYIFSVLFWVFRLTQYVYLTTIPLILFAWIRLIFRKPTLRETAVTSLGTLAYGTMVLYVLTGTGYEYARFYCTIQPFLTIFCIYWWIVTGKQVSRVLHSFSRP